MKAHFIATKLIEEERYSSSEKYSVALHEFQ
jgi:hypothetical protein